MEPSKNSKWRSTLLCFKTISVVGIVIGVFFHSWGLAVIGIAPIVFFMLITYIAIFQLYEILLGFNCSTLALIIYLNNFIKINPKIPIFFFIEILISLGIVYSSYQDWKVYKSDAEFTTFFNPSFKGYKNFSEYYRYAAYPELLRDSKDFWIVFLGGKTTDEQ